MDSERIDQMSEEAENVINALELPSLLEEAKAIQAIDPVDDFRKEIMGFFKGRIASITRAEHIKELVFQQLESSLEGGELNFDQQMTVLMRLARDNNELSDQIISMFRQSMQGGGTPLTEIIRSNEEKSDIAKAFEEYTPEELRNINEAFKAIRDITETGKNVAITTN